jgi:hypothetical protein
MCRTSRSHQPRPIAAWTSIDRDVDPYTRPWRPRLLRGTRRWLQFVAWWNAFCSALRRHTEREVPAVVSVSFAISLKQEVISYLIILTIVCQEQIRGMLLLQHPAPLVGLNQGEVEHPCLLNRRHIQAGVAFSGGRGKNDEARKREKEKEVLT